MPDLDVLAGNGGLCEMVVADEVDVVVNGLVGALGLLPTLAALRAGKIVAMANKEPLVMAGGLLLQAAEDGGGQLLPVDSEPSAMWQCLRGERQQDVERLILTASGGAFRDWPLTQLASVTPAEALDHPTWNMGPKITVDSATLMNKGFEVIEAAWLFGVDVDRVEVVIHRESIVHSMVEFCDGSFLAHLGRTDMSLPIQYALTFPGRRPGPLERLDIARLGALHFAPPEADRVPGLSLCYDAGREGGTTPAALNAANEVAVAAFLEGQIGFLDIHDVNREVVESWKSTPVSDVDTVLEADRTAREEARRLLRQTAPALGS
jgi:1-deoxy-D-xylulose-5-phosphate reductoisomerase